MIATIAKTREYLDYIEEHYNNVQKAWKLINDKCANRGFNFLYDDEIWHTIDMEVIRHDVSKLSKEEFIQYRAYFFPVDESEKASSFNDFESAWEHHKENNIHHWESWTKNNTRMDIAYLIMNIVDWVAMGFKFGDTAKSYYEKNKDEIKLPEWAVVEIYKIFDCIYD